MTTPLIHKKLPRGTTSLPKDVAVATQRARLQQAVAQAVAENGYTDTTVADIVRAAGVSKATFYEMYTDKEDCFLDAYRVQAQRHFDLVARAFDPEAHLADRMVQALTVYIKMIDAAPALSRAFTIAVTAATPRLREASEAFSAAYCASFKLWFNEVKCLYPEVNERGDACFPMFAAAVCTYASDRANHLDSTPTEAGVALARTGFGIFGLYGWAKACDQQAPNWGHPLHF